MEMQLRYALVALSLNIEDIDGVSIWFQREKYKVHYTLDHSRSKICNYGISYCENAISRNEEIILLSNVITAFWAIASWPVIRRSRKFFVRHRH